MRTKLLYEIKCLYISMKIGEESKILSEENQLYTWMRNLGPFRYGVKRKMTSCIGMTNNF